MNYQRYDISPLRQRGAGGEVPKKLEIACFNYESALIAQQGGADRVELCDSILEGGVTPNYETVVRVRKKLHIDLFVMIRPRGGNFIYSDVEFEQMKKDIQQIKLLGVNGFVFGILNEEGSVNRKQNKELVQLAAPLLCTFHRAFDVVNDLARSLEEVIDCKFSTLLTSGKKSTAVEGIENLVELTKLANGRITIMPGGGVRASNVSLIAEKTKTSFYHSSATTDNSAIANLNEVKLLKSKLRDVQPEF